jgi:hypothetical protein
VADTLLALATLTYRAALNSIPSGEYAAEFLKLLIDATGARGDGIRIKIDSSA